MAVSVRLDPRTERVLERLARRCGRTKSAVLREAVLRLAKAEPEPEETPYEKMLRLGLIGCVHSGEGDLSEHTGRRVREILLAKRRDDRAR